MIIKNFQTNQSINKIELYIINLFFLNENIVFFTFITPASTINSIES